MSCRRILRCMGTTDRGNATPRSDRFAHIASIGPYWHTISTCCEPDMRTMQPTSTPEPQAMFRYSPVDLAEFEEIIRLKLNAAKEDLQLALVSLSRQGSNGTEDTYVGNAGMSEGNLSMEREELMMLAARQQKFIKELHLALERIRTGSYGICRASGVLISKDRLRVVPHATMCIAAKHAQR